MLVLIIYDSEILYLGDARVRLSVGRNTVLIQQYLFIILRWRSSDMFYE